MLKRLSYALCLWSLGCAVLVAAPTPVREFRLDNGLKLIVQEDHRAPVVVTQVWYKVGSSYEHDGITGISHMLEHMMFKGTDKTGPNEFSQIISRNGGSDNAFTGRDYTAYFEKLERSRLPISFELEADRMRHLKLSQQEFAKERKVVMEERRLRTEDDSQAMTYEKAMSVAYQTSPYRHPIIGWMADIENYTLNDLGAWYEKWYAPNNATVVVVGDVEPQAVFDLARRTFGALPKAEVTPVKPRPEVPQLGEKRIVVRAVAELPYLILGYKTPSLKEALNTPLEITEAEVYALEVLAAVLDGGDSARLNKNLVRGKQVAASASASYDLLSRLNALFMLGGIPAQGHDVKGLEAGLRAEVERLRSEPITPEELARVKTQVIASEIYERDSTLYQAMQIGILETIGLPWSVKDGYVDKLKGVTTEQVQQAAKKYLVPERLTVAVLEPLTQAKERSR